jgi:hypothetical protein
VTALVVLIELAQDAEGKSDARVVELRVRVRKRRGEEFLACPEHFVDMRVRGDRSHSVGMCEDSRGQVGGRRPQPGGALRGSRG